MNILFISAADKQYDGRTRALLEVLNSIGKVVEITTSEEEYHSNNSYYIKKDNYLRYIKKCIDIGKRQKEIDCLFIDNRKASIPGLLLKKLISPRFVIYDSRELYIIKDVKTLKSKIGCIFEKKIINTTDYVIAANKERKAVMNNLYGVKNDILVFENFRRLKYTSNNIEKFKIHVNDIINDNTFNIISTAGCEIERNTLELVKASKKINFKHKILLVGCKGDREETIVREFIKNNSINNVILIPRINQGELKYLISKCQLGIAMYNKKDQNNIYCSSGKVYEFLYEGLPVATSDNPPLKSLLDKYQVGEAKENISDAINKVFENYYKYCENVKIFVDGNYLENNQNTFEECLNKIISDK